MGIMIRLSHFIALSAPSQARLPLTFLTFKRVVSSTVVNHLNFIDNNDSVQQPICNAVQHSRKVPTSLHSLSHHQYKSSSTAATIKIAPSITLYRSIITTLCQNSFDRNKRGVVDQLARSILENMMAIAVCRRTLAFPTPFCHVLIFYPLFSIK